MSDSHRPLGCGPSLENGPPSLTGLTGGVLFDVDGDGRRESVAWTADGSMAGFLTLDRNGNGVIDSGVELFGRPASGVGRGGKPSAQDNGFARLAELDAAANGGGNGDGVISAADAAFGSLLLWTDRNHDLPTPSRGSRGLRRGLAVAAERSQRAAEAGGVSQPNELTSLRGAGIERIELTYQSVGRRDQGGNFYRYRGTVHLTNGKRLTLWDVFLNLQQPASAPDPVLESAASTVVPLAWAALEATSELMALESADEPVVCGLTSAYAPAPEPPAVVIVHYYHTDALGSVRVVTDALGREVARHDFKPFGEEVAPADPPTAGKLFAGQLRDVELKQDYLNARQLSFRHGRFAAPDPLDARAKLANPQSFNRYAYVLNNPLRFVDPSGLDEEPSQDYAMEAGDRLDPFDLPGERVWDALALFDEIQSPWDHLIFPGRQPDGSYRVDPTEVRAAIIAASLHGLSGFFGESMQCVALVKFFTRAPHSSLWRQGQLVWNSNIPTGTAIATFDAEGRYPQGDVAKNSAIFFRQTKAGIEVFDQWPGHPAQLRLVTLTGSVPSNNALSYSVIIVR